MTEYRRHRLKGGCYFFTVNLAERNQKLLTENIQHLRESFRVVKHKHLFTIEAMVVLPEHLHTIWTLPEGDDDFSLRWRQIKSAFSRQIEADEQISRSRMRSAKMNEEFGKDDFGSIELKMMKILFGMWIISITIQ